MKKMELTNKERVQAVSACWSARAKLKLKQLERRVCHNKPSLISTDEKIDIFTSIIEKLKP